MAPGRSYNHPMREGANVIEMHIYRYHIDYILPKELADITPHITPLDLLGGAIMQ